LVHNFPNSTGNYGTVIDRGAFGIYTVFNWCLMDDKAENVLDINKNSKYEDKDKDG